MNRSNNHKLLFISDIRVNTNFKEIDKDQKNQLKWHDIIQPDYSQLKFRLPYFNSETNDKYYRYAKGKIYIQPFTYCIY